MRAKSIERGNVMTCPIFNWLCTHHVYKICYRHITDRQTDIYIYKPEWKHNFTVGGNYHIKILTSRTDQTSHYETTPCLKKRSHPLNSPKLCQLLTNFQNFCTSEKHEFCYNAHTTLLSSHRHVRNVIWVL